MAGEICSVPPLLVSDLHYSAVEKMLARKRSQFLELIGSVVVAVPADYTQYL
jgi:hypothetical protein